VLHVCSACVLSVVSPLPYLEGWTDYKLICVCLCAFLQIYGCFTWAAQYNAWLPIKLTPKGVVFSSLHVYAYVHVLHDLPESSLMLVQDHGLEAGLDIQLIPQCASALPEDPKTHPPQPVYLEMPVVNTNRCPCHELNACLFGNMCIVYPHI